MNPTHPHDGSDRVQYVVLPPAVPTLPDEGGLLPGFTREQMERLFSRRWKLNDPPKADCVILRQQRASIDPPKPLAVGHGIKNQADREWLENICTRGDYDDPRFVEYCEAQLREDLAYLRKYMEIRGQPYPRRLMTWIISRVEARSAEIRGIACRRLTARLVDRFPIPDGVGVEQLVRGIALNAFVEVWYDQMDIVRGYLLSHPRPES